MKEAILLNGVTSCKVVCTGADGLGYILVLILNGGCHPLYVCGSGEEWD